MDKSYKPALSWTRQDYINNEIEIPDVLINEGKLSEGELMDENDVVCWLDESIKTFKVIRQQDIKAFEILYSDYVFDVKYLCQIGKIPEDEIDNLIDKSNFEF